MKYGAGAAGFSSRDRAAPPAADGAPDGVITYRKRIGKTEICRRSGFVGTLGMRGMLLPGEGGDVPCPRGVVWKKD
jgi:hypothetical protein